ncbi:MAG: adenylate/guanylate cyclase domain-containing protein, partial [Actinomycetota bacterium]
MPLPTGNVTFFFTDIEGSTGLVGELGPRFQEIIDTHHALIREVITRHDGTVVSTEGDAFFAVFPSAASAVAGAVAAQQALAAKDWGDGLEIRVRMGLHTGEG